MLWVLVAWLGGCEATEQCRASLNLDGKAAVGEAAGKGEALNAACTGYCLKHDPLLDGKYRVWKAAGGRASGDKRKDIEGVGALKRILDACQKRCGGVAPASVKYENCPG